MAAKVKVPSVSGKGLTAARAAIAAAGLKSTTATAVKPGTDYTVTGQSPGGGSSAARGSEVKLTIKVTPKATAPAPGGGGAGGGTTAPVPPTTTSTSTTSTSPAGATPAQVQQAADMAAQDGSGGTSGTGMVTSGSTTAPASATDDSAQDQTDSDLAAFFSTGTGSAMHYDPSQTQAQQDGTTGGEA